MQNVLGFIRAITFQDFQPIWSQSTNVTDRRATCDGIGKTALCTIVHRAVKRKNHRRRSSVNFRGHDIFARKICVRNYQNARIIHDSCPKNYQNTLIFIIFARKINKISKFYMMYQFCPKNARILHNNCPKIFSRFFGAFLPPSPTPIERTHKHNIQGGPKK